MTIHKSMTAEVPMIMLHMDGDDKPYTTVLEIRQIMDNPREEPVIWTINVPYMASDELVRT